MRPRDCRSGRCAWSRGPRSTATPDAPRAPTQILFWCVRARGGGKRGSKRGPGHLAGSPISANAAQREKEKLLNESATYRGVRASVVPTPSVARLLVRNRTASRPIEDPRELLTWRQRGLRIAFPILAACADDAAVARLVEDAVPKIALGAVVEIPQTRRARAKRGPTSAGAPSRMLQVESPSARGRELLHYEDTSSSLNRERRYGLTATSTNWSPVLTRTRRSTGVERPVGTVPR